MKKLRLNFEELSVESFPTAGGADERATVRGYAATPGCTTGQTYDDTLCGLTWACSRLPPLC